MMNCNVMSRIKQSGLWSITVCMLFTATGRAQSPVSINLAQLHAQQKLTLYNRSAAVNADSGVIRLDEKKGEGIAWINGVELATGTIDIDLKGKDEFQKSFLGIAFHGLNDTTYDAVYFRPFNFRATDSIRRIHAVQYISHPNFPWKKLRDERNGIFEKAVEPVPDPNAWFHASIRVTASEVLVYVNRSQTPSLQVTMLNGYRRGKVGIWVGEGAGGSFKDLVIRTN